MKYILISFLLISLSCNGCGAPEAKKADTKLAQQIEETVEKEKIEPKKEEPPEEKEVAFDHSVFDAMLKAHVRFEEGRVDYAALKKEEAKLDAYLKTIAEADLEKCTADDKMALLINAYNGYTLKLILENYPGIKSIRDLKDPWKTERYSVGGETVSLDGIEHTLLRPIYKDPRIHFAVNCASVGCPALADFAYTGEAIEAQLEGAMKKAVATERYVTKKGKNKVGVSSIFKWYGDDFTKEDWKPRADTIPLFLANYANEEFRGFLQQEKLKVTFLDYDWSLNDVK